jgi:cytochrome P450
LLRSIEIDELTHQVADERLARATNPDDLVGAAMASPLFADLTPEEKRTFVRDLIASMLTAGYVSTGESIFWAFYVLARYPEAQLRARAEIERVQHIDGATREGSDRSAAAGSPPLDRLPYLSAVFSESLRLYPPAWYIGRIARRSVQVGAVEIDAGMRLICSPFVLHHMPAIWPEPELFRPERFLTDTVVPPRTFIPFGAGARACLGRSLALMEMSAMIVATLSRFDVRLVSDEPVSLAGAYSMQPRERVLFRVQRRA